MRILRVFRIVPALCGVALLLVSGLVSSQTDYRFERMWPVLQQPWYYAPAVDIVSSDSDFLFVLDFLNNRVHKLTQEGLQVTEWGQSSGALQPGDLARPRGIAWHEGELYVTDNSAALAGLGIKVFDENGEYLRDLINDPSLELDFPWGMDADDLGNVYVVDSGNARVVKLNTNGMVSLVWGEPGSGPGEFGTLEGGEFISNPPGPTEVAWSPLGFVYVADFWNDRVHIFDEDGAFVGFFDAMKGDDALLEGAYGLEVGPQGEVYVLANFQLLKFEPDGKFIEIVATSVDSSVGGVLASGGGELFVASGAEVLRLGPDGTSLARYTAKGSGPGFFEQVWDVAVASDGLVYVLDVNRLKRFSQEGEPLGTFDTGIQSGLIAAGPKAELYVTRPFTGVSVFDLAGNLLRQFDPFPREWASLEQAIPITVASDGSIYVADRLEAKVYRFTPEGKEQASWGGPGTGPGEFADSEGPLTMALATDSGGAVYVLDRHADVPRVQKFTPDGDLIGAITNQDVFEQTIDIALDSNDRIFAYELERVSVLDQSGLELGSFGQPGTQPGSFTNSGGGFALNPEDDVFIGDSRQFRVQVFRSATLSTNNKAVVLAGGGPYPGNDLWDATQVNANFAYRALTYQGFRKEEIYYLTADTDLDLDGNGEPDDVDADASNDNLQTAITEWAADADNLLIYLIDHGGSDAFRMTGTEVLGAGQLTSWVAQVQPQLQANCAARGKGEECGRVMVIYDACRSGSFMQNLVGDGRTVITSARGTQSAYFVSQGSLSFSNHFWTHVFNGQRVQDAFTLAREQTEAAYPGLQNPQLDADGDGNANETGDLAALGDLTIGNGATVFGEAPTIQDIVVPEAIDQGSSAQLQAVGVEDDDGIARVWAVIRPPDFQPSDSDSPITGFPTIDLLPLNSVNYGATFDQFTSEGTYDIAIYARDQLGNVSVPKVDTLVVENPLSRRAVIVAAGEADDQLGQAVQVNADAAYDALIQQGYQDEDIYYLSNTGTPGVDATPTLANVEFGLTGFDENSVQDLTLYIAGELEGGRLRLNADETLSANQLDAWLDDVQLQKAIAGTVTVLFEGPRSGSAIPRLKPPGNRERILVSSTDAESGAAFIQDGQITFSKFFWTRVLNGSSVGDAFAYARDAIQFTNTSSQQQLPQLDDNGNGIPNELTDGQVSDRFAIGSGVLLAGDDPIIGSVSEPQVLSGNTSATLVANEVTTTGDIDRVFAVITPPGFQQTGGVVDDLPTVDLSPVGKVSSWQEVYNQFTVQGIYQIAMYAVDTDGVVSFPAATTVTQTNGELPVLLPASIAGSWFDPTHAGEGFLIEVVAPGVAVVYWFTYDAVGNQRWFFGVGAIVENRIEIDELLIASGGVFGPDFDPDAISFSTAGSATFTFSGCDAGMVDYVVDGTPGQQNLSRITNIESLSCLGVEGPAAKSALHGGKSGSWFDQTRNGEGFLVEIIALPDGTLILVVYFFTFDPDGNLAWMVASGIVDGTDTLTMDVVQPVGGVFGPGFDPADVTNLDWGTWTFQLGCSNGSMSYKSTQPGYGAAEHALSRITEQLGVSCN